MRKALEVDFKALEATGAGELLFTGADLSEGGTFLKSDLLLEQGDGLSLRFSIPGAIEPVQTQARVAWVRRFPGVDEVSGMGIEFVAMNDTDRQTLLKYLLAES
ncbi:MAG: PilZ domain-containing protein [Myxococcaceae bacterium]|nr:PilZ domain-containing protein [Myxococcaceae bacterium]